MSAEKTIAELYECWRVLTEHEGAAIRSAHWTQLAALQDQKQRLREEIVSVSSALPGNANSRGFEQQARALGAKLILLELENAEALAVQRGFAEQERRELHRSSRNLRQVHQAYSHGGESAWQSYS